MYNYTARGKGRIALGLLGAIGSLYAVSGVTGCSDTTEEQKQVLEDEKVVFPSEEKLVKTIPLTSGAQVSFRRVHDDLAASSKASQRLEVVFDQVILQSPTITSGEYSYELDQVFLNENGVFKKYLKSDLGAKFNDWQKVYDDAIHQGRAEMKNNGFGLDNALQYSQKAVTPKAERPSTAQ